MAKSSMNIQNSTSHTSEHMSRESKVTYLLIHDKSVNNHKILISDCDEYLEKAKLIVKKKTGRSMQKKSEESFWKEGVINLNSHHKIEDVEKMMQVLQKELEIGKVSELAIHRDEGVWIETKHNLEDLTHDSKSLKWYDREGNDVTDDVISYRPERDIFYSKQTKKWYFDKEFEKECDTSKLQKHINFHAHVKFTMFNEETGKMARLGKKEMSKLQDLVSESLSMERGEKGSKTKRMTHWQRKELHDRVNDKKRVVQSLKVKNKKLHKLSQELVEEKKENEKIYQGEIDRLKKQLDLMIKKSDHTNLHKRELYKKVRNQVKELKKQNKNKNLTIEELTLSINELESKIKGVPNKGTLEYLNSLHEYVYHRGGIEEIDKLYQENSTLNQKLFVKVEENQKLTNVLNWEKRDRLEDLLRDPRLFSDDPNEKIQVIKEMEKEISETIEELDRFNLDRKYQIFTYLRNGQNVLIQILKNLNKEILGNTQNILEEKKELEETLKELEKVKRSNEELSKTNEDLQGKYNELEKENDQNIDDYNNLTQRYNNLIDETGVDFVEPESDEEVEEKENESTSIDQKLQ